MKPQISVVMSVYNEPVDWICQSIESILNQTFTDLEFIIVNDNPEGLEQRDILHNFAEKDSRIRIVENTENKGLTKSLNIGIEKASGKYIARMDADDISIPTRFRIQYDFMESHPEIDVCGSCAITFGNVQRFSSKYLKVPETHDEIKIRALFYSPMIHPSVMIRMDRLPHLLYNEKFRKAQDYVLWGDLLEKGFRLHNLQENLIRYRLTAKSGKSGYRLQQFLSADTVRANLLIEYIPDCSESDIAIHNRICNEQECDIKDAEDWLIKLRTRLSNKCPVRDKETSLLIERLWININIVNNRSLRDYKKSELTSAVSLFDTLRFAKRAAAKYKIFRKLIGGGKLALYVFCYLTYYCFAQYLPSNYSRTGVIYKFIRYTLVRHIFADCGKNVDVNRRANFGNGRGVSIGDNSGIGENCRIPNNITIGRDVMMAPNCTILSSMNHSFDRVDIPMREQGIKPTATTVIGNDVWIGQNVLITPGRVIKDGTIIAAGTVVTKNFPEYSIIGGNPSRLIRSRIEQ